MNFTSRLPTACSAMKSSSVSPGTSSSVPAYTLTPDGLRLSQQRLARWASAIAVRASGGVGNPGMCSSPAETNAVTPPCR